MSIIDHHDPVLTSPPPVFPYVHLEVLRTKNVLQLVIFFIKRNYYLFLKILFFFLIVTLITQVTVVHVYYNNFWYH